MKQFLYIFIIISIITSCNKKKTIVKPTQHVDIMVISKQNIPYTFDYPAIVQGLVDYQVIPRVSGVIFKQNYVEGTFVKKGTVLYEIDTRPFQLQLDSFKGNLVRDQGALDNYKIIYDRYKKLYQTNAVSLQDVETAEINYKAGVGNVQTDISNINQQKLNIEYCKVLAPADGYISERQVTIGNMVSAWTTVMNQINSVNDMYILFSVPENDRLEIQKNVSEGKMKVPSGYKFNVNIELADGSIIKNKAKVKFVDTRISVQNGVWNLRAYVNNIDLKRKLTAGQFVHVYLTGTEYINTFAVPQEAIFRDSKGAYVYELNKNNIVFKKYIVTGKMIENLWIIDNGIDPNDKIIVNGGLKVEAGDRVIIDIIKKN